MIQEHDIAGPRRRQVVGALKHEASLMQHRCGMAFPRSMAQHAVVRVDLVHTEARGPCLCVYQVCVDALRSEGSRSTALKEGVGKMVSISCEGTIVLETAVMLAAYLPGNILV